jgi:hypothetical protein
MLHRNTYHYWYHLGEAHAIRQMLGHTDLPQFVGDMSEALYRLESWGKTSIRRAVRRRGFPILRLPIPLLDALGRGSRHTPDAGSHRFAAVRGGYVRGATLSRTFRALETSHADQCSPDYLVHQKGDFFTSFLQGVGCVLPASLLSRQVPFLL